MEISTILWLIVVAVMLIIEIFTMGLTTIWFSLGAVVAAIASNMGASMWVQIILFAAVSVVVMLLVRPFAMKVMNKEKAKTNIDEMIGELAVVIETIDNQKEQGLVKFRGMEWMARSIDSSIIEKEQVVVVDSVSGVKLMVKKQG